jgi:hypothetical protein
MTTVDALAYALEEAKLAESKAHEARLAAEQSLIDVIGLKDEGTKSQKTDWYKVSITQTLNRKLRSDYGAQLEDLDPAIQNQIIRVKPALDVAALKRLATSDPDAYRIACRAIETAPAKPSVKVERIEQKEVAA